MITTRLTIMAYAEGRNSSRWMWYTRKIALAEPGLRLTQTDDVVGGHVRVLELEERLGQVLDRLLTLAGVAGVDVGPERCHHGDEPLA
jgi:hypothetical protein